MKQVFYVCNVCGNVVVKLHDSGLTPNCCGRDMVPLEAAVIDGSGERHVPVTSIEDNVVVVTVGQVLHPMTPEHYIEWIFIKTNLGFHYKRLHPGDVPEAFFHLDEGEMVCEVYEYCNIHKLWNRPMAGYCNSSK